MAKINKSKLKTYSRDYSEYELKRKLREETDLNRKSIKSYDIFLSHNFLDAEIIYGLKKLLEENGFSVFVDWIEAPDLDRTKVVPETADYLRKTMKRNSSLLYAVSDNSSGSKWMPWELGYSDGLHGKVAIVPISEYETQSDYQGQEYIGLYPYITLEGFYDPTFYVRGIGLSSKMSVKSGVR